MTVTLDDAAGHYRAGNFPAAARACLAVIARDPTHFDALHLLGVVNTNLGLGADGAAYLLRAAALRPDDAQVQANLGAAYGVVHCHADAEAAYRRALAVTPGEAGWMNNLGLAQMGQDRHAGAVVTFEAALAADPNHDAARFNLARALAALGRYEAAQTAIATVWDRIPDGFPAALRQEVANEYARILADMGQLDEALNLLRGERVGDAAPPGQLWNESFVLLRMGRFVEGWHAYETRWQSPDYVQADRNHTVLDLDAVAGQDVLVVEEQGRGDIIQCLRFIPPLIARGARVHLRVYDDLIALARELPGVETVIGPLDDEPAHDVRTSIMSLPLAFRADAATIPRAMPYLRTPAARIGPMRHRLGPSAGPRVGLVWSGSPHSRGRAAMPAEALAPLLKRPGVQFHCLQKAIAPEDKDWIDRTAAIATHQAALADFADTAALIDGMDLIITVDTAVAHLAGALGRPVWIMLPFAADWRWLMDRADSPWYPTARLFRQAAPGHWDDVVATVAAAFPY